MRLVFSDRGWEDFTYWIDNDRKIASRLIRMIKEIERDPYEGVGKPEALRHELSGFWSRRITAEHRLVYAVEDDQILIAQSRYHY